MDSDHDTHMTEEEKRLKMFVQEQCLIGQDYMADGQFLCVAFNQYLESNDVSPITTRHFNKLLLKHLEPLGGSKISKGGRNVLLGITRKDNIQTITGATRAIHKTEEERKEAKRQSDRRYYLTHRQKHPRLSNPLIPESIPVVAVPVLRVTNPMSRLTHKPPTNPVKSNLQWRADLQRSLEEKPEAKVVRLKVNPSRQTLPI